jgi:hypothetical protein
MLVNLKIVSTQLILCMMVGFYVSKAAARER